jgi:predicted aspartyl protease
MTPLRWLCVLLLAGCTASPPPAGPPVCDLRKAAEIPVTFERGFISVPAMIENKPVTMLVDTGAESSVVTPSAMLALRLQTDRRRHTTIHGAGGTFTTQNALLQSFEIGGMAMLDQSTAVGPLPSMQGVVLKASGLLGADWLTDFDVELDLPHRRMALYRAEGCGDDTVPWQGRKTSVPVRLYGRGLVILSVELDGQPVTALLDSGANFSELSEVAAARIGIDALALAQGQSGRSTGMDGAIMTTHRHRFGRFRIGTTSYANPEIAIGSLHVALADMLLGADWLRTNRVWISYATRRVTIQSVRMQAAE